VVGSPRREPAPGARWLLRTLAISAPDGAVLSVPPAVADAVRRLDADLESAGFWEAVAELVCPGAAALPGRAVFRWTETPAPLPEAGEWLDPLDPRLPEWLRTFDGEVLVALDENGGYVAGAGRKQHDRFGHELSVGTEPAARGRGLARALVARLARRILDEGAIPTYIHDAQNVASCRVAEAVGFQDRGWRAMALWGRGGTG
jgi:GNAT superfamily N-acetyltransferase